MHNIKIVSSASTDYEPNDNIWTDEAMMKVWAHDSEMFHEKLDACFKISARSKIQKEFSLVALENDKHVGSLSIEPLKYFLDELSSSHFDNYRHDPELKPFIGCVEYGNIIVKQWLKDNDIAPENVAHFCGLAVDPAYRKKGLGTELAKQSLMHFKKYSYLYAIGEATGDHSKKIMENFGGVSLGCLDYDTYCETNGYNKVENHKCYCIFYVKL